MMEGVTYIHNEEIIGAEDLGVWIDDRIRRACSQPVGTNPMVGIHVTLKYKIHECQILASVEATYSAVVVDYNSRDVKWLNGANHCKD